MNPIIINQCFVVLKELIHHLLKLCTLHIITSNPHAKQSIIGQIGTCILSKEWVSEIISNSSVVRLYQTSLLARSYYEFTINLQQCHGITLLALSWRKRFIIEIKVMIVSNNKELGGFKLEHEDGGIIKIQMAARYALKADFQIATFQYRLYRSTINYEIKNIMFSCNICKSNIRYHHMHIA